MVVEAVLRLFIALNSHVILVLLCRLFHICVFQNLSSYRLCTMVSKYKGIIILWNLFWVMSFIHLWPIALAQRTRTKLLYDAGSRYRRNHDSIQTVRDNLGTQRRHLSPGDRAKLDIFMALYGIFDETDQQSIATVRPKIERVLWYARELYRAMYEDTFSISIFCNDDHLVSNGLPALTNTGALAKDEYGRQKYIYKSAVVPGIQTAEAGKCDANPNWQALMVTTRNRITDVFTICARAWPRWTEHIDDYKGLHVSQMLGLYLQNIDIKTPELTLIHEFTHSESLFAQWVMEDEVTLDDPALGYTGQGAYGFENIYQLAQDPRTQHKALKNSDTFAFLNGV
ncbi:hypothetical protein C8Q69DRAFT_441578 [Paecilomyces variotii]|uniref:Lysine-specific metallo-endopeptidase domain-containing protein n=1 Tax=Byssochlamys spectabilis TaxID=264951 RepID=A0A443HZZ8_BYSSP|nr:hypothetical protein C8Q69DRAFT_441578 [Paecilomyces variotii]RWQ97380.1 hypothetical protein C8Q69DRAFT_441578 [Paecilomyces variotii]